MTADQPSSLRTVDASVRRTRREKKVAYDYAHPDTIVSTDRTEANADQKGVRIVEVDVEFGDVALDDLHATAQVDTHVPRASSDRWPAARR